MTASLAPSLVLVRLDVDSAQVRFLSQLNNPDQGVVCVWVRPNTRRFGWLSRSILEALGKDLNASGQTRNDQEDEAYLTAWLAARDITDLVVVGAEALLERLLHDLAGLAYTVGLRLWLVADHHLPESVLTLADIWPTQAVTAVDFDSYWKDRSAAWPAEESPAIPADIPVPDADFPIFYSELERLLPEEEATLLRARYRAEFKAARQHFKATESSGVTEEVAAAYFRRRLADCPTKAEMVTTVRSIQAAAFMSGWLIQVDFPKLVAAGSERLSALIANPATWRKLLAYRQTYRPVVCALVAAGLDLATINDLPATAISADYSTVTADGENHPLPEGSEAFVRAHSIWRALNTRSDRFVAPPDAEAYRSRVLNRVLSDAATELGLVFSPGPVTRSKSSARSWLYRNGVTVQKLTMKRRMSA